MVPALPLNCPAPYLDKYQDPTLWSGFMAVCEKPLGQAFYLTNVYHEWFIIENP